MGPFPSVGLTLTWFIWDRNLALHITLYSVNFIVFSDVFHSSVWESLKDSVPHGDSTLHALVGPVKVGVGVLLTCFIFTFAYLFNIHKGKFCLLV